MRFSLRFAHFRSLFAPFVPPTLDLDLDLDHQKGGSPGGGGCARAAACRTQLACMEENQLKSCENTVVLL